MDVGKVFAIFTASLAPSTYLISFSVYLFPTPTPPLFLGAESWYVTQAGPEAMIFLHARITGLHHHALLMLQFLTVLPLIFLSH